MNTRFLEAEFDYVKPASLSEALDVLAERPNVKIFAGGTDLIVKLKVGADIPMDVLLDINGISELFGVVADEAGLAIAAAEKLTVLEKHPAIQRDYEALCESIQAMASVSVRNMGTLGGNFCNASPVADAVGPVICYGGSVVLQSKKNGQREIPAEEFCLYPGVSVLQPDEILTAIKLPKCAPDTGGAFIKLARVKSDVAKLSVCCVFTREAERVRSCRIAMGAVAAKPLYLEAISASLSGKEMTKALAMETAETIASFIRPIDDNRTTAEYRSDVTKIIAAEAIEKAWFRSGGTFK